MNLPRLSNQEFEEVERIARVSGTPLNKCPTCGSKAVEIANGIWGWENGKYKLDGRWYDCDCKTQMQLRKHYLLANIGYQYMRLNWDEYSFKEVKPLVETYLDTWEYAKINGTGLEFSSITTGNGKTFCATYVGKELVKRGEKVFFYEFHDMIGLLNKPTDVRDRMENKIREVPILILDDVKKPYTFAQEGFFAENFEALVRHRQNFNKVIIMTTNLTEAELNKFYPRVYSLLQAKQTRIVINSEVDYRIQILNDSNSERALNEEVCPIT